jgi:hypothetical protein
MVKPALTPKKGAPTEAGAPLRLGPINLVLKCEADPKNGDSDGED